MLVVRSVVLADALRPLVGREVRVATTPARLLVHGEGCPDCSDHDLLDCPPVPVVDVRSLENGADALVFEQFARTFDDCFVTVTSYADQLALVLAGVDQLRVLAHSLPAGTTRQQVRAAAWSVVDGRPD